MSRWQVVISSCPRVPVAGSCTRSGWREPAGRPRPGLHATGGSSNARAVFCARARCRRSAAVSSALGLLRIASASEAELVEELRVARHSVVGRAGEVCPAMGRNQSMYEFPGVTRLRNGELLTIFIEEKASGNSVSIGTKWCNSLVKVFRRCSRISSSGHQHLAGRSA